MDNLVWCMCFRFQYSGYRVQNTGYGVTLPGLTRISTSGIHTADLTHPTHSLRRTHAWQKYPSSDLQGSQQQHELTQDRIKDQRITSRADVTCYLLLVRSSKSSSFLILTRHTLTTLKLDLVWIALNWICHLMITDSESLIVHPQSDSDSDSESC